MELIHFFLIFSLQFNYSFFLFGVLITFEFSIRTHVLYTLNVKTIRVFDLVKYN